VNEPGRCQAWRQVNAFPFQCFAYMPGRLTVKYTVGDYRHKQGVRGQCTLLALV
jgi:hypothetical protein